MFFIYPKCGVQKILKVLFLILDPTEINNLPYPSIDSKLYCISPKILVPKQNILHMG